MKQALSVLRACTPYPWAPKVRKFAYTEGWTKEGLSSPDKKLKISI